MKILTKATSTIIRIVITCNGYKDAQYINLHETTMEDVLAMIKQAIIKKNLSPFPSGRRTRIDVRESLGTENRRSRSISFFGLSTEETKQLIIDEVNQINRHE